MKLQKHANFKKREREKRKLTPECQIPATLSGFSACHTNYLSSPARCPESPLSFPPLHQMIYLPVTIRCILSQSTGKPGFTCSPLPAQFHLGHHNARRKSLPLLAVYLFISNTGPLPPPPQTSFYLSGQNGKMRACVFPPDVVSSHGLEGVWSRHQLLPKHPNMLYNSQNIDQNHLGWVKAYLIQKIAMRGSGRDPTFFFQLVAKSKHSLPPASKLNSSQNCSVLVIRAEFDIIIK